MDTLVDFMDLQARSAVASQIPTNRFQQQMLAVIYVIAALAYVAYGLRMYSRISTKQTGLEDWLITAATVFSLAFMSAEYFYFKYNYAGFPKSEIPKTFDLEAALFWTWIIGLLYNPILALVKSSTLVFMLRIAGHKTRIRWTIHDETGTRGKKLTKEYSFSKVINAINVGLMVSTFLVVVFQTTPVASFWDKTLPVQHSIYSPAFGFSTFTLTIVTDILVLAIPIWAFIGIKARLAMRLGVIMIFMAGGLVTVIGIIRLVAFSDSFWDPEYDFMYTWAPSYSAIEVNLAIIAACLPALRPLLRAWLPHLFGTYNNEQSGPYHNQNFRNGGRSAEEGSIMMRNLGNRHVDARGRSHSPTGSQDSIFNSGGIRRTTDIHVAYSDKTKSANSIETDSIGKPGRSDPALTV